jgi:hypothetical protein
MVIFESGYTLPGGDQPLTHARIAHSGNWETGGTAAVSGGTATDYFTDGPDNSLTYEKWKPTSLPATWDYTFASSTTVDYCCVGAHTMGTSGNTIQVQKYDSGSWTDVIASTVVTSDQAIFCIFEPVTDTRMRIRINNGTAPEIGVVKFGSAMQMQRPMYGGHSPLLMARQTEMRSNNSATGEFLGRTKLRNFFQTEFAWSNLSASWVRTNWRPFQLAIEEEPFFIAWRPITFSEAALCYVNSMPIPQNQGVIDLMQVSMSVTGYGYD